MNQRQWVFVDTGAFYAIKDRDDAHHQEAVDFIASFTGRFITTNDCTSFAVMERLNLLYAFAFDEHFEQTGRVTRLPRV